MSVGLYLDVHVPASITRGLVLRGVDVLTAQIDGTTELKDPDLLDRATELAATRCERFAISLFARARPPQCSRGSSATGERQT